MLSFLFPPVCPLCGKTLLKKHAKLCSKCEKKNIFIQEPVCYSCGKQIESYEAEYCNDCIKHPKSFTKGMGLCIYREPVIQSLAAIKYKNKRVFAEYYLSEIQKRKRIQLKKIQPDLVIPVPLHASKRRKRGFNQAEIFAEGIADMIGCPMEKKLVLRKRDTKPLKKMDPLQRKRTLAKAFQGNQEIYEKTGRPKTVLVIDDIYTTGATSEGVTRALKKLGVSKVYIFCIAIGQGYS